MTYVTISMKIIVVGDFAVGKTSLCKRFAIGSFREDYKPTIGVDIYASRMEIPNIGKVILNIWDTAGQERFQKLYPKYYRGAKAAVIVYDITSRLTFNSIPNWLNSVKEHAGDIATILVGNKADLEPYRQVRPEEGEKIAKDLGIDDFLEASARSGKNVEEVFRRAVNIALSRMLRK